MTVAEIVGDIQSLSRELELSALERERLQNELGKVYERLRTREYRIHSFSENTHNVLERVRDVYAELEFYCRFGRTWEALLLAAGLTDSQSVIDLCPGFTPKIELGLCYASYSGHALLVNKDAHSLQELEKFLKLFAPQFSYDLMDADIFQEGLPPCDIVAANHVLDDLALDRYCTLTGISPDIFYQNERKLRDAWLSILDDADNYLSHTVSRFCDLVQRITKPQGSLIVSQYQSYIERILELPAVTDFAQTLLKECTRRLCEAGFVDNSHLAARALPVDAAFAAQECRILRRV